MEGVTVSTLVQAVGDVFTAAMDWVGEVFTEMATNPILLLFCIGLPLCGIAIGFAKRLLGL